MYQLHELGWSSFFQQHVMPGGTRIPGRVVEEQRAVYRVACEFGELSAETSGSLRHAARNRVALPAVGDWVLVAARIG